MNFTPKNTGEFFCKICDFKCSKQSDYSRHILTAKHKNRTILNDFTPKNAKYICDCGKEYKARNSLWYHKKKCNYKEEPNLLDNEDSVVINEITEPPNEITLEYLLQENIEIKRDNLEIKRDNLEMKKILMDMCQKMEPVTTITNIQNNNQKFNLNFFLNEQCKDAINFSDFIKNLKVTQEDLRNNGQLGFVEGMSKILIDNLNKLTLYERPIHCTDIKRETLHIKDDDVWHKEEDVVEGKLNGGIQDLSRKSMRTLMDWKASNPDYLDGGSEFSEECIVMQRKSIAGLDREDFYPKVIQRLARYCHLTKDIKNS